MIHISEVLQQAEDAKPHQFRFVTKKGHIVEMINTVVTSSNFKLQQFNLKSLNSLQIRTAKYALLIEYDYNEIFL